MVKAIVVSVLQHKKDGKDKRRNQHMLDVFMINLIAATLMAVGIAIVKAVKARRDTENDPEA